LDGECGGYAFLVRTSPEDPDDIRAEVRSSLVLVAATVATILIGLVIGFAF
jgi:hypothetical protein